MENEKYLPIGTVVLLKGGKKELMIIGYCILPDGAEGYDKNGKEIVASTAKPIKDQGPFSDMKVVVLVNGETCSAGESMTDYLSKGDNVSIMGSTYTWGAVQATGGSVVLTNSEYSIRFPIIPELDDNGQPNVDVGADYHARLKLDYFIEYDRDGVVERFENPDVDYVLEEAIEYIEKMPN